MTSSHTPAGEPMNADLGISEDEAMHLESPPIPDHPVRWSEMLLEHKRGMALSHADQLRDLAWRISSGPADWLDRETDANLVEEIEAMLRLFARDYHIAASHPSGAAGGGPSHPLPPDSEHRIDVEAYRAAQPAENLFAALRHIYKTRHADTWAFTRLHDFLLGNDETYRRENPAEAAWRDRAASHSESAVPSASDVSDDSDSDPAVLRESRDSWKAMAEQWERIANRQQRTEATMQRLGLRASVSDKRISADEYAANLPDEAHHAALEVLCRVFDDGADVAMPEFVAWYNPSQWLDWSRGLGAFIRTRIDRAVSVEATDAKPNAADAQVIDRSILGESVKFEVWRDKGEAQCCTEADEQDVALEYFANRVEAAPEGGRRYALIRAVTRRVCIAYRVTNDSALASISKQPKT